MRNHVHTLEDVHRCVANVVSDLKSISQSLDLRESFLEILRSLLNRLLLCLHQVERVATLGADRGLQSRDSILEEGVAHVTDTGWIIAVRVVIGERTPLRSRINDFVSNLCGLWSVSAYVNPRDLLTTSPQVAQTMSPLLNSSVRFGGNSLQSGHIMM